MTNLEENVFVVLALSKDTKNMSLSEVLNVLLDKNNEPSILKSPYFLNNMTKYLEAYDYHMVTSGGHPCKITEFHDLAKLVSILLERSTFEPEILSIMFRILRLSSQSGQTLKIIVETTAKTVESGLLSGNYVKVRVKVKINRIAYTV